MATPYGRLQEFRPESDSIKGYLERVSLYFTANEVTIDKRVPILLSSIGASTYALLSDLLAPVAPGDKSFDDIAKVLRGHFEPQRSVIAERFHFHKREQAAGETVADFDAALRKLAVHCKFEDKLEDALRDRFVCGLRHEAIQRRLLSETTLTYHKAVEVAKGMEAAEKETKAFKTSDPAIKKLSTRTLKTTAHAQTTQNCYRCGRSNHRPSECKFKDAECHACGKTGHIATACRSKLSRPKKEQSRHQKAKKTHHIHDDKQSFDDSESEFKLHKLGGHSSDPIRVTLSLNGKDLEMEVDTGAALSVISEATKQAVFPSETLRPSDLVLKTYTNERMEVKGTLNMRVQYGDQKEKLVLVVVAGDGPSLMGRNWLKYLRLDWRNIFTVRTARMKPLNILLQSHQELFSKDLGHIHPFTASLKVQPDATPRFHKARSVPFAIKDAISQELDRLEQQRIISPVTHSQWAAPIVPVPKKDGKFRLCGDYKVTVNQALAVEEYPLPTPEELFSTLAGGKLFSKLDLSQAYLQLPVEEASKPYLTINTHKGLYAYNRLPFGVASAPMIFQKMMDAVLQGITGVTCYIDDILISSADEESHLQILEEVFNRLSEHGFRLKLEKCEFLLARIEYLGHIVSKDGIQPMPSKVEAIVKAPTPTNVHQLRSFLGLTNYYGKFIPNLSTILHPLNALLQAKRKWKWSQECAEAFEEAKRQITSAGVLIHYNPTLPISMAADASAYGVGAVISHVFPDGSERPIAFASRTLSTSERNYAQIEKEALSLVFGVQKFHRYLYGRRFTLITDHKPLTTILGPKKGIPSLAAARLQRWAILLSAYDYDICYKPTNDHGNADGLSRLPLPTTNPTPDSTGASTFNIGQVQALPVTSQDIRNATRRDPVLSKVYRYVEKGWPSQVDEELKPFKDKQTELTIEGDCVLWGIRVIIPKPLQNRVLESLHTNHPGMTRMKMTARSHFWWKGLDKAIEALGKSCLACQQTQPSPAAAPLHPWVWPDAPWKRVHADFAGPFLGHTFLIVVDAHSKWPEVEVMSSTTTEKTIDALRLMFARHGLPEQLITDNGPQFTSTDFKQFLKGNQIKHILSAPYHPASNGLAERFVQTLKRALKASEKEGKTIQHRLAEFLFEYRATPHSTTKVSPSELLQKRKLRTRFSLLMPNIKDQVTSKQAEQKAQHDRHVKPRALFPGTPVMVRDYTGSHKWISGVVLKKLGPVTYQVETSQGRVMKRHIDQLRSRAQDAIESEVTPTDSSTLDDYSYPEPEGRQTAPDEGHAPEEHGQEPQLTHPPERRYPLRVRRPPDRLMTVLF